jgi:short-chain fatty acids transporter
MSTVTHDRVVEEEGNHGLVRLAHGFTEWSEKWFPDAFVFVILATFLVVLVDLGLGAKPILIAKAFGDGFWTLIPFTMQMAMVAITGFVVAASPPIARLITRLAKIPRNNAEACAWVAFVSMAASYFSWALSLILGGLIVKALARRTDFRMDYRAGGAAAYLGLGATWALGLNSSAAMLQANPGSLPKAISDITGVIPMSDTIFLWQSVLMFIIIVAMSVAISYFSAPSKAQIRTAEDLGIDVSAEQVIVEKPTRPGEKLEFTVWLPVIVVVLAVGWFYVEFQKTDALTIISSLNTYNFFFIVLGMLLHWNMRSFQRAVADAVPTATGILIQFPFYGAISLILTGVVGSDGVSLSHHIANIFISVSTQTTLPVTVGAYSAVLGFFIPSGGGKWILEAPYVMQAAKDLHSHMGWMVMVYNAAEAMPNLINPFFMLPLMGLLGLKARAIVGFCFTQFLFHVPVVLFLLWALGRTLLPS